MKNIPIVIIGSGCAGLTAALLAAEKQDVIVITKLSINDTNTQKAQGGIVALWSQQDSSSLYLQDTLNAGHGLCDYEAVQILAENSRVAIQRLIKWGVHFDKNKQHELLLGLEGAHSIPRILHAGGDATGAAIQDALKHQAIHHPNITFLEYSTAVNIITDQNQVLGVEYYDAKQKSITKINTNHIVLAAGGAGQLFQYTSNPTTATGESVILAYQAGAILADLEFYQFHPTALNLVNTPNFLISEALRGEGATLINQTGEAFMASLHPQKDLAPRDIVARAIAKQMLSTKQQNVYLDATHINHEQLINRFPTIFQECLKYNIDIRKDLIPITPVAHYMIGGVMTDHWGCTSVKGLYAAGEVARTGVHGSNRIASNSLLEATIFAERCVQAIQNNILPDPSFSYFKINNPKITFNNTENQSNNLISLQQRMWEKVGLIREAKLMEEFYNNLKSQIQTSIIFKGNLDQWLFQSMQLLAFLMVESALERRESRGAHYRKDYPQTFQQPIPTIIKKS